MPDERTIKYKHLKFRLQLTGFKHTGLFPEQAVNWDWMIERIKSSKKQINVLNLFAYTGGATIACASAGAKVCHVDASKGMVSWAAKNAELSNLSDKPIRWIVDDCMKFLQREIRRGNKYDAVIMDPPSYGRGPNGEIWKIEDELYNLIEASSKVLTNRPLFFLVNSYTTGFSPIVPGNMIVKLIKNTHAGKLNSGEIGLPASHDNQLILPCGIFSRWESDYS